MKANRMPITLRLDSFEGPLDLLLYLIQSHELDISRVSISKITDQYLAYVQLIEEINFDAASEFLVMAATLLHWKSRALLPKEEKLDAQGQPITDEITSQEDLVRQLLEHQRFMEAGENLAQLPLLGKDVFARSNSKPPVERVWREMNVTHLAISYQDMLARLRKRTQILKKETVSIADKIMEFSERIPLRQLVELRTLLSMAPSRNEIVATFLAALELSRMKKMKLYQEEAYSAIYMELLEQLSVQDTQLAIGFEAEVNASLPSSA